MTPTRRRFIGAVSASTVIGLAGCLGGDGGGGGGGTPTATETGMATPAETATETATESESGSATVQVRSHSEHGDVLVGPDGLTLYNFDADTQGSGESACPGIDGCDEAWPPLSVESPDDVSAGSDVEAELSTLERDDGTIQVVANGWPLYYFASDEEPGDAGGHGVNDAWWVMSPAGVPERPQQSSIAVRNHDEHGDILVDGEGMTLYNFDSDEQGTGESTCAGGCAESWPPLTVDGEPTVGDGVTAEVTTFDRGDGSTQVAANGWPLYYFASDEEPGDVQGQGVNEVWWVLGPDGVPKRPDETGASGAGTDTETTDASGGGDGSGGPY